ncbi:M13 family metallopeptidase [Solicola gregarius]|uniref:Peptidase M13 n=1 Tax=Solicola gregarius TaxID=2908642 RepID=A0AA46YJH6_9ACTN|nr:M13-type metalloendopeptidase [Solicola gregarius]UYM04347.1 peptidase M13 [Solicola gregarius]
MNGIDISELDSGVRPADDLFRHVNGRWLDRTEIPPDRPVAGSFSDLRDEAELAVREILDEARASEAPDGSELRKIGDLYASFMDEEAIEASGRTPIASDLADVDSVTSVAALVHRLGAFEQIGVGGAFGLYVAPDAHDPERNVLHLVQGGLGLPDESYYTDEQFADVRTAYVRHVAAMLELAGLDDAAGRAERVMRLETDLAGSHWDRVACRDAQRTYNPMDRAGLDALSPGFDWGGWLDGSEFDASVIEQVVVSQPTYFTEFAALLRDDRLDEWRDWARWNIVHAAAPFLPTSFVEENFDFYGRTLSGTAQLRDRWKRGVGLVEMSMGEAVGKIYVDRHYPPSARARMDELIGNLIEAYRESINGLDWMGEDTRKKALAKLDSFTPKVGHPLEWRDYGSLTVERDHLWGNVRRVSTFQTEYELAKLAKPVDRNEWFMTPQTVNAYYNPTMNEIVFPAAILQPPFFYPDADDAVNYGAIGAVIGHEIGHGFDDQGSHYDGDGRLANWWTDDDRAAFEERTTRLVDQYDVLTPADAPDRTVNGSLTIGENIGDLGGLSIAYKAFRIAQVGVEPPEVDGMSAAQRFFLSWAQAWQSKVRPEEVVRRLTIDPHAPPEFRCNEVVRNIGAFYDAFEVTADDALWLDPEQRVSIW